MTWNLNNLLSVPLLLGPTEKSILYFVLTQFNKSVKDDVRINPQFCAEDYEIRDTLIPFLIFSVIIKAAAPSVIDYTGLG